MARLFTIVFPFGGKEYRADITVDDSSEPYSIAVNVSDKSLHHLLPGGKAVFNVDAHLLPLAKEASNAEILKHQILTAFNAHESEMPPVNMW